MVSKQVKVQELQEFAKRCGLALAVYLLTGLTPAWAQQQKSDTAPPPVVTSKSTSALVAPSDGQLAPTNDYTVCPEDLLDVLVMDVPEVSRTYRVSSNGLLTLPLLPEPIPAAGESLDQLSRLIAIKFHDAGMLNNAQVSVSLRETRLHTVLVSGEVKNPQAYPVFGPTRLIELLVKSGGLTNAASDDAVISRGEIGQHADLAESARTGAANPSANGLSFTLKIRKLVETGDDNTNILLYPGDRITVQKAELIYVLGAVMRPGGYVLSDARQHTTVLKALALAGDVNNIAKRSHILILRRDPAAQDEKRDEIPVNYKAMVKGQIADIRLMPDDILFVPESGGLKALHTSTQAAVQLATAGGETMLIYR
ncbi:MAG TPA: polysaccharide biosynthesis/export family protein [Terriglobia bacterium]|nr:polysaccharide biosynthesis/export family protein [Terriglobia bacterium]